MRCILISIIIIFVCVLCAACGKESINYTDADKYVEIHPTSGIESITTASEKNASEKKQNGNIANHVKPLEKIDFLVSDGKNKIMLDSLYKDFKVDMVEEKADNNYVGEIYSGDFIYKVFQHKYADFDLYTSNIDYNLKNRDFDEYFITQITLKTSQFATHRYIAIGSQIEDLIAAYGSGKESNQNGETSITYTFKDMKIQFVIDSNKKVKGIILYIEKPMTTPQT